jgi:regulator of sigma E protease
VLDGGHFAFLCWEGIRGKPASERVVVAATYLGLAFVLSLMLFVLCMDITSYWAK